MTSATIWIHAKQQKNTSSEGENVSANNERDEEIQRLSDEVKDRREKADTWDTWNIRAVWFAAFAAALLAITAIGVSNSNRRLLTSSDDLDRAKDRKLQADLRLKDEEIAKANARASEAAQKAEEEMLARIKLEGRFAWRRIVPAEYPKMVGQLRPFHGSSVEVTQLGEAEASSFAADILKMFSDAKWNVSSNRIGTISSPQYGLQCMVNEEVPAGRALATVLKSLPTAKVVSVPELPMVGRILVGLKPPP
jgi:hypothetical protein